jgi:hypothetical protein
MEERIELCNDVSLEDAALLGFENRTRSPWENNVIACPTLNDARERFIARDSKEEGSTSSSKDPFQHLNAEQMKFLAQEEIQEKDLTNSISDEQRFGGEINDDQIVAQVFAHEDANSHNDTLDTETSTSFIGLSSRIIDVFIDRFDNVLH